MKLMNFSKRAAQAGFTMIELLVVIAILGVLAVVVLGAINPLEQINRGRDTSSKADAEAIISAVERYNANISRFPWMNTDASEDSLPAMTAITDTLPAQDTTNCALLDLLGQGDGANCNGTQEIKAAMVERVGSEVAPRNHWIYYQGDSTGDSVYVCFTPQSNAFRQQAEETCAQWQTTAPDDMTEAIVDALCPALVTDNNGIGGVGPAVCLP